MAVVEIKRQVRATARAWRKFVRRRISPSVALRLFMRSGGRVLHALSLVSLLVVGGAIVAVVMITSRLFFRARDLKHGFSTRLTKR